ncbi:hypothetical protein BGZ54_006734 [Gamsiella multidivaricata]|nr:hypothetical protein BGZ54_006734 [Gamsiella multidivaricata]
MSSNARKSARLAENAAAAAAADLKPSPESHAETTAPPKRRKNTKLQSAVDNNTEVPPTNPETASDAPKKKRAYTKRKTDSAESTTASSEGRPKPKRPRKRKSDDSAVTTGNVSITAVSEEAKPKRPRKTKKMDDSVTTANEEVNPKGPRKRKTDALDTAAGEKQKPKRPRKAKKKDAQADTNPSLISDEGQPAITTQSALQHQSPINLSDPCSVLPTETWHRILAFLPLSQVAKISSVSKAWLDGSRSLSIWRAACEQGNLGEPKKKYRTHMALACSQANRICDRCYCVSPKRSRASAAPLPVSDADDQEAVWALCLKCRQQYYDIHPEPLRDIEAVEQGKKKRRMTVTKACNIFHLTDDEIYELEFEEHRNPHYASASPMKLFDRFEVQQCALEAHGGWVGIEACRKRQKKRAKLRRERAADPNRVQKPRANRQRRH